MFNKSKDENVKQESVDIKDINIKEEKKSKRRNPYYLFLSFVIKRMKEDKLYLFSFIVTLCFVVVFSLYNISEAEGLYKVKEKEIDVSNNVTPTVDSNLNTSNNSDELDIKDYVGIYSKEVILDKPLAINETCNISTYKIAYQIKKDKSISKYFINDCIGTVEIWSDELSYVSTGGARYISANNIHYLFAASSMKEVDGDTFKIDDDLNSLKNKIKLSNTEVYFEDKSIIVMTYDNLYLLNDSVGTDVLGEYKSNGGALDKKVYKSDTKRLFKFIVFNNGEELNCYTAGDETFVDGSLYKIYSIKYNNETGKFNEPKEILARNKSAGCTTYNEDLENLKE